MILLRKFHLQWIFIAILPAFIFSCKKEYITRQFVLPPEVDTTAAHFVSFSFGTAQNGDFVHEQVDLSIDGGDITGHITHYSNISALIPSFVTNEEAEVRVNGVIQKSDSSVQDFRTPVTYEVISASGKVNTYTVEVMNFTGLPVIRINTEGKVPILSKDDYVNGHVYIDGAGAYPDLEQAMKIKGRGNSTWGLPKKPYKIKFDNKETVFGFPADKEWVLLANYTDKSALRNSTAFFMGHSLSDLEWTPRSVYVELFINERYEGTYQLCEQVKIAKQRVNAGDEGFLIEVDFPERMTAEDVFFKTSLLNVLFNIKEPEVDPGSDRYNYIQQYVNDAEQVLYGATFTDPETGYQAYLDVNSFVDWYLINEITKNADAAFGSSCFMSLTPGGKLKMGPVWDYDISLGNVDYGDASAYTGFYIKNAPWISRLFEDPAFVVKVKDRFQFFKENRNKIIAYINKGASALKWSVLTNNSKWQTLYNYTWPNNAVWGSYENEIQFLKNWLNNRFSWLDHAFAELGVDL